MQIQYSEKLGAYVGLYEGKYGLSIIATAISRLECINLSIERLYKRNKKK